LELLISRRKLLSHLEYLQYNKFSDYQFHFFDFQKHFSPEKYRKFIKLKFKKGIIISTSSWCWSKIVLKSVIDVASDN